MLPEIGGHAWIAWTRLASLFFAGLAIGATTNLYLRTLAAILAIVVSLAGAHSAIH